MRSLGEQHAGGTRPAKGSALVAALATVCACHPASGGIVQEIAVRGLVDAERPLAGVVLSQGGKNLATTREDGAALLRIEGAEGEVFEVRATCPEGYEGPALPLKIPLLRLATGASKPEYVVRCVPKTRTVVVTVRAEGGANVPVVHLGRVLGRTDASGAWTHSFVLPAGEEVTLTLDTSASDLQRLRPVSPKLVFRVGSADEVVALDAKFTEVPLPPPPRAPAPERPVPLRPTAARL